MAYPTEAEKGTFIGIFWAIFNVGGVVGSAVAFGQNFGLTVSHYVLRFFPNSFPRQSGAGMIELTASKISDSCDFVHVSWKWNICQCAGHWKESGID